MKYTVLILLLALGAMRGYTQSSFVNETLNRDRDKHCAMLASIFPGVNGQVLDRVRYLEHQELGPEDAWWLLEAYWDLRDYDRLKNLIKEIDFDSLPRRRQEIYLRIAWALRKMAPIRSVQDAPEWNRFVEEMIQLENHHYFADPSVKVTRYDSPDRLSWGILPQYYPEAGIISYSTIQSQVLYDAGPLHWETPRFMTPRNPKLFRKLFRKGTRASLNSYMLHQYDDLVLVGLEEPKGAGVVDSIRPFLLSFRINRENPEQITFERILIDLPDLFELEVASMQHFTINRTLNHVVFSRQERGGGLHLYEVKKSSGDTWGDPVPLGPHINALQSEVRSRAIHPHFGADGHLYFSSNALPGFGGYDVFRTRYKNGSWSIPVNLGPEVNSRFDEISFRLHAPQNAFFASNHKRVQGERPFIICQLAPRKRDAFKEIAASHPFHTVFSKNGKEHRYEFPNHDCIVGERFMYPVDRWQSGTLKASLLDGPSYGNMDEKPVPNLLGDVACFIERKGEAKAVFHLGGKALKKSGKWRVRWILEEQKGKRWERKMDRIEGKEMELEAKPGQRLKLILHQGNPESLKHIKIKVPHQDQWWDPSAAKALSGEIVLLGESAEPLAMTAETFPILRRVNRLAQNGRYYYFLGPFQDHYSAKNLRDILHLYQLHPACRVATFKNFHIYDHTGCTHVPMGRGTYLTHRDGLPCSNYVEVHWKLSQCDATCSPRLGTIPSCPPSNKHLCYPSLTIPKHWKKYFRRESHDVIVFPNKLPQKP